MKKRRRGECEIRKSNHIFFLGSSFFSVVCSRVRGVVKHSYIHFDAPQSSLSGRWSSLKWLNFCWSSMFFLLDGQKFNSHGSFDALQSETDDVEIIGVRQRKTKWKISLDFFNMFPLWRWWRRWGERKVQSCWVKKNCSHKNWKDCTNMTLRRYKIHPNIRHRRNENFYQILKNSFTFSFISKFWIWENSYFNINKIFLTFISNLSYSIQELNILASL